MKTKKLLVAALALSLGTFGVRADDSTQTPTYARERIDSSNRPPLGELKNAKDILGMDVIDGNDAKVGKVKELAVDLRNGHVAEVIISHGGVLGVDEKSFAVPPSAVTYDAAADRLRLSVAPNQFADSAAFEESNWANAVSQHQVTDVYRRYGVPPYYLPANQQVGANLLTRSNPKRNAGEVDSQNTITHGPVGYMPLANSTGQAAANSSAYPGEIPAMFGDVEPAGKILGAEIVDALNRKMGKVENIVLDMSAGRVVEIVLVSGGIGEINGFLTAVPPEVCTWNPDAKNVTLDARHSNMQDAPQVWYGDKKDLYKPTEIYETYARYDVRPYFHDPLIDTMQQNVRERQGTAKTPVDEGDYPQPRQ